MAKPDFLDDVVGGMSPPDKKYGADMSEEDGDGMDDESDPEESQQDRVMAAKSLIRALGLSGADASKVADALKSFVAACG